MVAIRQETVSKIFGPQYRWIARILIAAAALYGPVLHEEIFAGTLRGEDNSGKITRLQFRLRDSFPVSSVTWSPDGQYIATASTTAAAIHIWDVQERKIVAELPIPYPAPYFHELSFSPDGRYLAACDGTGVLRIYFTSSWAVAHSFNELHGHAGCDHPVFSSDSREVASVAVRFLEVFSVPSWRPIKNLELNIGWGRADFFNAIAYLPNTHTVLIGGGQYVTIPFYGKKQGSWDGRVWFFGPDDHVPSRTIRAYRPAGDHGGGGDIRSLTTSPDGRYIVTGVSTGGGAPSAGGSAVESIHVFRTSGGQVVAAPLDDVHPAEFGRPEAITYTHDGRYIVVPHDVAEGWIHILHGTTFKVIDLIRSNAFNLDVAVNQVNDEFAVGVGEQVIVWSLPDR